MHVSNATTMTAKKKENARKSDCRIENRSLHSAVTSTTTERRGRVVNPSSYSEGPGFLLDLETGYTD
jgi:hypothetical protein